MNEPTGNKDKAQEKYERNPENITYYESEKIHRRKDKKKKIINDTFKKNRQLPDMSRNKDWFRNNKTLNSKI
jgi:hypothetical protein